MTNIAFVLLVYKVYCHDGNPDDRTEGHHPTHSISPAREEVGTITGRTVIYPGEQQNKLQTKEPLLYTLMPLPGCLYRHCGPSSFSVCY